MSNNFNSTVRLEEPLARYTSWQVGGMAKQYYNPVDLQDLVKFLQWLPIYEPIFWLGHGSNVLIRDKGFDGTVVHVSNNIKNIKICDNTTDQNIILKAEAGATCAAFAKFCQQHGLVGAEFYAGIPGTIGGALAMNAGAFGGETWRYTVKVETINRQGQQFIRYPNEFEVGYRKVVIPNNEWFTAGYFSLQKGDINAARKNITELLAIRKQNQPIDQLTCGSVFCNPDGQYAAKLIESAGLKGTKRGNAIVSTKHANFIINQGGALASDIESLIQHIQEKVWGVHKIQLKTEVKIIGEE